MNHVLSKVSSMHAGKIGNKTETGSSVHKPSYISSVDRMEKDGNRHKIPCP
jgi:hypothetical protein